MSEHREENVVAGLWSLWPEEESPGSEENTVMLRCACVCVCVHVCVVAS